MHNNCLGKFCFNRSWYRNMQENRLCDCDSIQALSCSLSLPRGISTTFQDDELDYLYLFLVEKNEVPEPSCRD